MDMVGTAPITASFDVNSNSKDFPFSSIGVDQLKKLSMAKKKMRADSE